jgi:hypothetical protein
LSGVSLTGVELPLGTYLPARTFIPATASYGGVVLVTGNSPVLDANRLTVAGYTLTQPLSIPSPAVMNVHADETLVLGEQFPGGTLALAQNTPVASAMLPEGTVIQGGPGVTLPVGAEVPVEISRITGEVMVDVTGGPNVVSGLPIEEGELLPVPPVGADRLEVLIEDILGTASLDHISQAIVRNRIAEARADVRRMAGYAGAANILDPVTGEPVLQAGAPLPQQWPTGNTNFIFTDGLNRNGEDFRLSFLNDTGHERAGFSSTFNTHNGIWVPLNNRVGNTWVDEPSGVYFRFPGVNTGQGVNEIPYALVSDEGSHGRSMFLTVLETAPVVTPGQVRNALVVPIVALATGAGEIRIEIEEIASGRRITSQNMQFHIGTTAAASSTITIPQGVVHGRDVFTLHDIHVNENSIGTIRHGSFVMSLPPGYRFANIENIQFILEGGLQWNAASSDQNWNNNQNREGNRNAERLIVNDITRRGLNANDRWFPDWRDQDALNVNGNNGAAGTTSQQLVAGTRNNSNGATLRHWEAVGDRSARRWGPSMQHRTEHICYGKSSWC